MKKICILGSGAFGTAIATVLTYNGHEIALWCKESDIATEINQLHTNATFLPGVTLSEKITATDNLALAVDRADYIFIAVPVQFMRSVLQAAKPFVKAGVTVVLLSKGIEQTTLLLPTEIVKSVLGQNHKTVVVAGPSFAQELAQRSLTGLVIAGPDDQTIKQVRDIMQNEFLVMQPSYDMLGVQLCGAVKNAIALGSALLDGAGYSSNTQSLFLVKVLTELRQLLLMVESFEELDRLVSMGPSYPDTFQGLAGIGDIMLTTYSPTSRNVKVGKLIGQGQSIEAILESVPFVPESINSAAALEQLIKQQGFDLPILLSLNKVIHNKMVIKDWVNYFK